MHPMHTTLPINTCLLLSFTSTTAVCKWQTDIKVKEPDFEAMKRNEIKYLSK